MAYLPLPLHDGMTSAATRGKRIPTGLGLLAKVPAAIRLWRQRIRDREVLAGLSELELRDLRFSRSEIAHEVRKPFWRE